MNICLYVKYLRKDFTFYFIPNLATFMMVDCSGGTVDLATYKLLENKGLSEIIECIEDSCGSTFVDKEFVNFLGQKLGYNAIELFKNNNYSQFQYIIQEFCQWVKLPFTGDLSEYRPYYLDIEEIAQYVSEETKYKMEESDWIIEIKYNDVKNMFDPVIDKIISLIQHSQLQEKCSTILLVGGFSESKYLQKRIKEELQHVLKNIYIPNQPMAAISRGATLYGLNSNIIGGVRILKYTYGIKVRNYWTEGDPIDRELHDGRIDKFDCLIKRGTQINQEITKSKSFMPLSPTQSRISFKIYYTNERNTNYCDDPGMKLLGKLTIDLPSSGHFDRLFFECTFGRMEIAVTVKNETNGQYYRTTFDYND